MSNQRLLLIETSYGEGILFDQKDTVQAYQILSRATFVKTSQYGGILDATSKDIEIKLVRPDQLPEAPAPVAPTEPASEEPIPF